MKIPNPACITPVILAGGSGERLRPILGEHQKVMAFVGGRPFLSYVLDQIQEAGFTEVILSVGYRAEEIQNYFGNTYRELKIRYEMEMMPLGTGGALAGAAKICSTEHLLVMNGDSLCEIDFGTFVSDWIERDYDLVMAVAHSDEERYGRVAFDDHGKVQSFQEKSSQVNSPWVNAGVYLLRREIFQEVPAVYPVSLEKHLFPDWISKRFFAQPVDGHFYDIGTPEGLKTFGAILDRVGIP